MKKAIIIGINGMDGSHLADFLLTKNYEVIGLERKASKKNRINTSHLENKISFFMGDLTDSESLETVINKIKPQEIYNLASQSFPFESWSKPEETSDITGIGVLRILEVIRKMKIPIKFFQAGSSEMFVGNENKLINEKSDIKPVSPYGVSKAYGYWITKTYRETYNMFNCNGFLFSHDSPRRGFNFVTRKITNGVANIKLGKQKVIKLGNLDSRRDFGYAPDYVKAMWLIMQQDNPDDYVISTMESHSIRDILDVAFSCIGIKKWNKYVEVCSEFVRGKKEQKCVVGDNTKIKSIGWKPELSFEEIIKLMVSADIKKNEV